MPLSPARSPLRTTLQPGVKAELGITAAEYVETVRLEAACRLLETTHSSIEQIARTCGFDTLETMTRTFRRRLNTTPGERH